VGGEDRGVDGGGGQLHSDAGAGCGQAVFDAGGGCVFDIGAWDGGDGARRAGCGEGVGRGRGGRAASDAEDGGDRGGDVSEVVGSGAGWGQRGFVVAWGGAA